MNASRAAVLSFGGAAMVRLLRATMRLRHEGREHMEALLKKKTPFIWTFWHAQILMSVFGYLGKHANLSALISHHGDGELIARVVGRFGYGSLRGSTTQGGAMALRGVLRHLRDGGDVVFTPDGPRGPRREAQMGVVEAARLSGAPILPSGFAASKKKC